MGFFYNDQQRKKTEKKQPAERARKPASAASNGPAAPRAPRRPKGSALLERAALGCAGCTLNTMPMISPKMEPSGSSRPTIYVLGEAPTREDDERGELFTGKPGALVRGTIPADWQDKLRWNNTIRCRPPNDRDPSPLEIECCRHKQIADIEAAKPKVVVTLGSTATNWATGRTKITAWHGRMVPVTIGTHQCFAYPTFDPALVLGKKYEPKWEQAFKYEIRKLFARQGFSTPAIEDASQYSANVHTLLMPDMDKAEEFFAHAEQQDELAIDIETKGYRPYKNGAKILSISFGTYDETFAIGLDHREAGWTSAQKTYLKARLKQFLLNSKKKWAHNLAFELEWLSWYLDESILFDTEWGDTMSQAYVLDARSGALSLDDLTRIYFGFDMKSVYPVDVGNLDSTPLPEVLMYNSGDTKYTDLLRWLQQERLELEGLQEVYEFHVKRVVPIVRAQARGLQVNTPVVQEHNKRLTKQISEATDKISKLKDVRAYCETTGKEFNPESPKDVIKVLVEAEVKEIEKKGGGYTTDESVLENVKHPLAPLVLELRGARKLKSTYIDPFMPKDPAFPDYGEQVWDDGLIHCSYHHTRTITGRLSSSDPNTQNFPKREAKEIRSVICAPPDHWIVSFDQGQIEARGIAMASRDKVLVQAVREDYDIHMDWAEKIAYDFPQLVGGKKFLNDKNAMKKFRSDVKNVWTFPLFYGSILLSIAQAWGLVEYIHGKNRPVKQLVARYDEFWQMFTGVVEWQNALRKQAKEQGFVSTLTGRRRYLPLSDNEAINSPIQGTASDIVVDVMARLTSISYTDQRPQLQPVMNVHDDLTLYLPNQTLEDDIEVVAREMVRITFPWENVPLLAECSVGRNWGEQEEIAKFRSQDFGFKHYD